MSKNLLLFFISMFILLVVFVFGMKQIYTSFEISDDLSSMSKPFPGSDINLEYLKSLGPAYDK